MNKRVDEWCVCLAGKENYNCGAEREGNPAKHTTKGIDKDNGRSLMGAARLFSWLVALAAGGP